MITKLKFLNQNNHRIYTFNAWTLRYTTYVGDLITKCHRNRFRILT